MIADDLFTAFQKNGLRDRATAGRYRRMVLEPGAPSRRGIGVRFPRAPDQPRRVSGEDGEGQVEREIIR